MKRVKEISALAGVTKRTLQYYDDEGLLFAQRSKVNYRLYDEESLERLWQILFYREIGFGLSEIKSMMNMSESERQKLLEQKIKVLKETKLEIEEQIHIIENVRQYGLPPICYEDSDDNSMTYVECIGVLKDLFSEEMEGDEEIRLYKSEETKLQDDFVKWVEDKCGIGISDFVAKKMEQYLEEKKNKDNSVENLERAKEL